MPIIDVRKLANPVTQVANENQTITWRKSTGYTTDDAGKRVATFTPQTIQAQIQGLSAKDLMHMDGLNIQGVFRSVHMFANVQGVVRIDTQGGDLLTFPEIPGGPNRDWLVINVMETWATWSRVIVSLQV